MYVTNEIHNSKGKNAMWKVIKKCLPRTETSKPVYSKDKKLLPDEFNDFFLLQLELKRQKRQKD